MIPAPQFIGGARVIKWSAIDHRHRPTGACKHYQSVELQPAPAGIAIATHGTDASCSLFYCNENWEIQNDTFHQTLEDAIAQAEAEFAGVAATLRDAH